MKMKSGERGEVLRDTEDLREVVTDFSLFCNLRSELKRDFRGSEFIWRSRKEKRENQSKLEENQMQYVENGVLVWIGIFYDNRTG